MTRDIDQASLEPRRGFTVFDMFHFLLTFIVALELALITNTHFGRLPALIAFVIAVPIVFIVLDWLIAACVLFLYRRLSAQSRIGYEVACYIRSHRKHPRATPPNI